MENLDLNLTDLSEEELNHISDVLSRDKKLQESQNFIKVTVNNNNYEVNRKQQATANDLVSAEIDRIKRLTPVSEKSGASSPLCANSDNETPTHDEGFFKSFAGMISRKMGSIDFSSGNKDHVGAINALAGAIMKMEPIPKAPFNYSPRESTKKKPTLLELASSKRSNSPELGSVLQFDSSATALAMNQYKRSRSNALFYSAPNCSTIPRNFKTNAFSAVPISENGMMRPRSPSLPKDVRSCITPKLLRKSPLPSPNISVRNRKSTASSAKEMPLFPKKNTAMRNNISTGSEGFEFKPSPEKKVSPDARKSSICVTPTFSYNITRSSPDHMRYADAKQTIANKFGALSTQSNDSGIGSRPEYFMRTDDNESLLDDDTDMDQVVDYEPDTESVYDVDPRRCNDFSDDVSFTSARSSYQGSPMRRPVTEYVPDSWDESDSSSGVFVGNIGPGQHRQGRHSLQQLRHVSPAASNKPRWVKSKGNRGGNRHIRNESAGSDNAFLLSTTSSPSLSAKSLSLPRAYSPAPKRDSSPSPTHGDVGDTIGNLEISVVYYSSDCLRRKNMQRVEIPSYGTKSATKLNCHVLSRKEYTDVTNADLKVTDTTPSGCQNSSYGELHVTINGAKFQDYQGKIKAPNTYVKCYLLPDKFHNSKMKSAVIKKSKEPRWEHTFILAGFSQSELRDRSLEIIVGSWHFKKQEVLGGAILSVGQGGPKHPWINSTKAESYIWKTALQISGNKVKALLPLRAHMKPTYM